MPTPYQLHVQRWGKGCGSPLCKTANKIVLARGQVPCEILFVGEAPGISENLMGLPFVGPSGMLLDSIIKKSIPGPTLCPVCGKPCFDSYHGINCPEGHGGAVERENFKKGYRYALTNLLGCIPLGEDGTKPERPCDEDIEQCSQRLIEFVQVCQPKLIVCVGDLPNDHLDVKWKKSIQVDRKIPRVHIKHPSAILQANETSRGLMVQRCVVTIQRAVEDMEEVQN